MRNLLQALAGFLRSDRTFATAVALGVLTRRQAPVPLMIGGILLVIGVHLTAFQSLGSLAAFLAVISLELLAEHFAPALVAKRPTSPLPGVRR